MAVNNKANTWMQQANTWYLNLFCIRSCNNILFKTLKNHVTKMLKQRNLLTWHSELLTAIYHSIPISQVFHHPIGFTAICLRFSVLDFYFSLKREHIWKIYLYFLSLCKCWSFPQAHCGIVYFPLSLETTLALFLKHLVAR